MSLTAKQAILFDKDGTLIEYNNLWTDAIYAMVPQLEATFPLVDSFVPTELFAQLGMLETRVADASPLGTGTTRQIASVLEQFVLAEASAVLAFVQEYFYDYTLAHQEKLVPIGNVRMLLTELRAAGYHLGVVTSDDYESTMFTLKLLAIDEFFDFVATGDRFAPKPEREALQHFMLATGIMPANTVFVGDSSVDIQFSRHCALGVGVTSGVANAGELGEVTQHVYPSIHEVPFQELFSMLN